MVPQVFNEQACVICNEAITNPICMHCLEEEMKCWAADFDAGLVQNVQKTEIFPTHEITDVKCIKCGKNMDVCPHCYSKDLYQDLKGDNFLAETFADNFNFDLKC